MHVLTPEQKRSFDENGFLLCEQFFSPQQVAVWQDELAALLQQPTDHPRSDLFTYDPRPDGAPMDPANPHRVWRIMDMPLMGDSWFRLACHPRIVGAVSDLLGPDVNFHNGKAILKPPHFRPKFWGWHQDFPYERHTEPDLLAALTYVHDMDGGSGATEVLPGSHKGGGWDHATRDGLHAIDPQRVGTEAKPVRVRAGDVVFLHVLTVHRAGPNESATSRCGVINEYKTAATRDLWGNRLAFAELPLMRGGRPFCVSAP